MSNQIALEWLDVASHDIKSAHILYDADHYTDSIATSLQQAIEKMFKAMLAKSGLKIPKTHDLTQLYFLINQEVELSESEINLLDKATLYYKTKRYPNPSYSLPDRQEVKELLDFADKLFGMVSAILKNGGYR